MGHLAGGNRVGTEYAMIIVVLAVLVVVAIGGLVFLSGGADKGPASSEPASGGDITAQADPQIEQGNPVVATLDGAEITRADVLNFIQQLPEEVRQQPIDKLFSAAQEQVISARVIEAKTKDVNLDDDPAFQQGGLASKKKPKVKRMKRGGLASR